MLDGWVFVSGTTGFNADGTYPPDAEGQCKNCFRNIASALEQAGTRFDNTVRNRTCGTTQAGFERILPIIRRYSYPARPANTTIFAQLVKPHMRGEIAVTARLP